ncbi:MAG: GNAT family N-acetyltransferase [Gammaproteobacteria bacterium]
MKKDNEVIAGVLGKIIINNVVYIDDLFVKESFRNQDCATSLMDTLEKEAKSRGCYMAYLDTINLNALRFYEKRGYTIFATLENVPCPGVNAFYLKKDIK